jgi:hypothetical protein
MIGMLAGSATADVPGYTLIKKPKIGEGWIDAAKSIAQVPSNIVVDQTYNATRVTGDTVASIQQVSVAPAPTSYTLNIHVTALHSAMKARNISPQSNQAVGYIAFQLLHELGHYCLMEAGFTGDQSGDSCAHIAIEFAAAQQACDEVANLKSQAEFEQDEAKKQALLDKAAGLCSAYSDAQVKLNQSAPKVRSCACGQPPFSPPSSCPALQIPTSAGGGDICSSSNPPAVVIDPCAACT